MSQPPSEEEDINDQSMSESESDEAADNQTVDIEDIRHEEIPSHRVDGLITLGFFFGAVVLLYLSLDMTAARGQYDPGAAFWPRMTLAVVAVASLVNAGFVIKRLRESEKDTLPDTGALSSYVRESVYNLSDAQKRLIQSVVVLTLYLAALNPIGFILTTPVFLFVFSWIAGYRSLGKLAVFSVGVTLVLFGAFGSLMNIAFPYGNGIFRQISIFFQKLFNDLFRLL